MGRIEDAAAALKAQRSAVEAAAESFRIAANEDLVEFVQLMRTLGVRPETTYKMGVEYKGLTETGRSVRIASVALDATPVTGWVVRFTAPSECSNDVWVGVLTTPDLALWKVRIVRAQAPVGGLTEYTSLRPEQLTPSSVFPGGASQELAVVLDEPIPDTHRRYELGRLAELARSYIDTVH